MSLLSPAKTAYVLAVTAVLLWYTVSRVHPTVNLSLAMLLGLPLGRVPHKRITARRAPTL